MIYAHLSSNRCTGTSQLYQVVNDDDLIPLEFYDLNVFEMYYDQKAGKFLEFNENIYLYEILNVAKP